MSMCNACVGACSQPEVDPQSFAKEHKGKDLPAVIEYFRDGASFYVTLVNQNRKVCLVPTPAFSVKAACCGSLSVLACIHKLILLTLLTLPFHILPPSSVPPSTAARC